MAKVKFTKTISDDDAYAAVKQARVDGHAAFKVPKPPRSTMKGEAALAKLHGQQNYAPGRQK
jgi:hypothetical protein